MTHAFLSTDDFRVVVDSTPLISIDLIIRGSDGRVLLGKRSNRPAQGYWFVPGGRVYKNESLAAAFRRLTLAELGVMLVIEDATYLGLFEHFYEDSVFGENVSTHYVVNAFELTLRQPLESLPTQQHTTYQWWCEPDLLAAADVHCHTQWYFSKEKGYFS